MLFYLLLIKADLDVDVRYILLPGFIYEMKAKKKTFYNVNCFKLWIENILWPKEEELEIKDEKSLHIILDTASALANKSLKSTSFTYLLITKVNFLYFLSRKRN